MEALVCREGAWAELTVKVTSVVMIRRAMLGFWMSGIFSDGNSLTFF